MLKRAIAAIGLVGLGAAALANAPARASTPASGSVTGNGSSVSWTGALPVARPTPVRVVLVPGNTCATATTPGCDSFNLSISGGTQHHAVDITISDPAGNAGPYQVEIFNQHGAYVGGALSSSGLERVRMVDPAPGTYSIRTSATTKAATGPDLPYKGVASMTNLASVPNLDDEEQDCFEAVPARVGHPVVDGRGVINLKTHVLLDGVTQAQAQAVINKINADSYGPEQLRIVPTFETVNVPSDGSTDIDFWSMDVTNQPTKGGDALIEWTKAHLGGVRPFGTDLVYTMTTKELFSDPSDTPEDERDYGLLGIADCIGGVRWPNHAIAVGEYVEPGFEILGRTNLYVYKHMSAKVMAHELGHVLGAHHHYGNCHEGGQYVVRESEPLSPCTLMFPDAGLLGLDIGTLESSTMRGHAHAYTGH